MARSAWNQPLHRSRGRRASHHPHPGALDPALGESCTVLASDDVRSRASPGWLVECRRGTRESSEVRGGRDRLASSQGAAQNSGTGSEKGQHHRPERHEDAGRPAVPGRAWLPPCPAVHGRARLPCPPVLAEQAQFPFGTAKRAQRAGRYANRSPPSGTRRASAPSLAAHESSRQLVADARTSRRSGLRKRIGGVRVTDAVTDTACPDR